MAVVVACPRVVDGCEVVVVVQSAVGVGYRLHLIDVGYRLH